MRKYSLFSASWRAAILQKSFYQDVAQNWRGIGLIYLLLILIPCWLAVLIPDMADMNSFIKNDAPQALKDFPSIHIVDGVASSDAPQPYVLKGDNGEALFAFDTTGQVTKPSDVGAQMLLTSTELVQQDAMGNVQRHRLSELPYSKNTTVDQAWLISWIAMARNWLIPAGLAWGIAWRLVAALIFAAIGLGFNAMFRGGLSYAALLRLSMMAATVPVVVDSILWLCNVPFTCGIIWMFLNGVTLLYLLLGVKAAAQVIPRRVPAHKTARSMPPGMSPPPLPSQPTPPAEKPGAELFP